MRGLRVDDGYDTVPRRESPEVGTDGDDEPGRLATELLRKRERPASGVLQGRRQPDPVLDVKA